MWPRGLPQYFPQAPWEQLAGDNQGRNSLALLVLDTHLQTWGSSREYEGVSPLNLPLGCDPAGGRAGARGGPQSPVSHPMLPCLLLPTSL